MRCEGASASSKLPFALRCPFEFIETPLTFQIFVGRRGPVCILETVPCNAGQGLRVSSSPPLARNTRRAKARRQGLDSILPRQKDRIWNALSRRMQFVQILQLDVS